MRDAANVIMDYPTAWAFVKSTDPADHHERCSWRTTNGCLLCDCDVLWNKYELMRTTVTLHPGSEARM